MTLRNVLRVNALSSGLTGLLLAIFPDMFSSLFAIGSTEPFIWVGVFLIVFAIGVVIVSMGGSLDGTAVSVIIFADAAWVVASVAVVLAPLSMSVYGILMILSVACWVSLMAMLQYRGLRQIPSSSAR